MLKIFSLVVLIALSFVFAANGQKQDAAKSRTGETKPISYGLVIDNSGSQRPILENVIESAKAVVEANDPDDETFVVRFVDKDNIHLVQDFTSSIDELSGTLDELFIEGGMTAIADAVNFSAKHLAAKENSLGSQKILILITDGEDRNSATKIGDLLKFLKAEQIKVFALGLADEKIHRNLLDKLAKETGGKNYIVQNRAELKNIIKELTAAVRAQ